jgi:hypothetical protein
VEAKSTGGQGSRRAVAPSDDDDDDDDKEGLLPHSQQPTNCPYSEPDQSV